MKFSAAILALPALAAASIPLQKRAACDANLWISGLKSIEASIAAVNAQVTIYATTTCKAVTNLPAISIAVNNLNSRIAQEAASINACSPGIADCAAVNKEITGTLYASVSALQSNIIARKSVICCSLNTPNNLAGVVRVLASAISTTVTLYGSSVKAKVPAACTPTVTSDVNVITSYIQNVIKTVVC